MMLPFWRARALPSSAHRMPSLSSLANRTPQVWGMAARAMLAHWGHPVGRPCHPCTRISLGDIRYAPTRWVLALLLGGVNFWSNAPKFRPVLGGVCVYFLKSRTLQNGRKSQTCCKNSMQTWVFQIGFFNGFPNTSHIPPPPYGTHSGHKSGNNADDHRKRTELAHSVLTPRDMCDGGGGGGGARHTSTTVNTQISAAHAKPSQQAPEQHRQCEKSATRPRIAQAAPKSHGQQWGHPCTQAGLEGAGGLGDPMGG